MNRQEMEKILDAYEKLVYDRAWEIRPDLIKTLKTLRHNCLVGNETVEARSRQIVIKVVVDDKPVRKTSIGRMPLVGYSAGIMGFSKRKRG